MANCEHYCHYEKEILMQCTPYFEDVVLWRLSNVLVN